MDFFFCVNCLFFSHYQQCQGYNVLSNLLQFVMYTSFNLFIIRVILSHADIDTIEIRSDEEEGSGASKARRTYNYRVTYACCLTCFIYSSFVYNIFDPLNRKRGWSLLGRKYVSQHRLRTTKYDKHSQIQGLSQIYFHIQRFQLIIHGFDLT